MDDVSHDPRICVLGGQSYHPANALLYLLPITYVYEATAGWGVNGMCGSESRAVDLTRDKVSDYCRHSVYQGGVISAGTDLGVRVERTLDVEENGVAHEVWPLEHTPQFWDVLLSIRSHCVNPLLIKTNPIHILPPTPTLVIITNEYHLPQRRLVPGQYRQVIPDFYLARFVDDDGLDRDDRRETAIQDPLRRQHADRAKDDPSSCQQPCVIVYCFQEIPRLDHFALDEFV